ncbi:hypothetical protein IV203_013894 [Nitzschia inconspicua]|uniref:Uncharacterized protein n=1 Tax=Nitzschia inconspicua TaxID=303405 RepID=A0A9K3M6F8_9STRA|nr:hypothetical protein IV203_013894 [Nitzschia inconspicua]
MYVSPHLNRLGCAAGAAVPFGFERFSGAFASSHCRPHRKQLLSSTTNTASCGITGLQWHQPKRAAFSSTIIASNEPLKSLLKEHKVFERINITPGKLYYVLNVVTNPADVLGYALQETIVQELASNDMAELDDMYSVVGCVTDSSMLDIVKRDGSYDRIDDASDYHSLQEYLVGYKTHSFQLVVGPSNMDEDATTTLVEELVRITQNGGFLAFTSFEAPKPLLDDGKLRLVEMKNENSLYQVLG